MAQAGLLDRFPHQRAAGGDRHLQGEFTEIGKGGRLLAVGQQARERQQQEGQPHQRHRQAQGGDVGQLEDRLAGQHLVLAVDHQVGAGADHGQRAAQDGAVTQWNHQLGRCHADPPRPGVQCRDHGGHQRRVVEQAAERSRRCGDAQLCPTHIGRAPQQAVDQQIDASRCVQTGSDHEHGGDGDQPRVAESGQRLLGAEYPAQAEHGECGHHHQVRAEAGENERRQHPQRQADGQPGLPLHVHFPGISTHKRAQHSPCS